MCQPAGCDEQESLIDATKDQCVKYKKVSHLRVDASKQVIQIHVFTPLLDQNGLFRATSSAIRLGGWQAVPGPVPAVDHWICDHEN